MLRTWPVRSTLLLLAAVAVAVAGCAGRTTDPDIERMAGSPEPKTIRSVRVVDTEDGARVRLEGSSRLAYMSVKQPMPPGVILYFEGTTAESGVIETFRNDTIADISVGKTVDNPSTARVEIRFEKDMPYQVQTEGNTLVVIAEEASSVQARSVDMGATQVPEAVNGPRPGDLMTKDLPHLPATRVLDVESDVVGGRVGVHVRTNGRPEGLTHFTIAERPRIVIDIPEVGSPFEGEQSLVVGDDRVKSVRHFASAERFRLVLDATPESLQHYEVIPRADGVDIWVGKEEGQPEAVETPSSPVLSLKQTDVVTRPAVLKSIDFSALDHGKSKLIIGTDTPVAYDVEPKEDNRVLVTLKGTRVPKYNRRPIITTRFESALDRVLPVERGQNGKDAALVLELRERVPYLVEQKDNRIEIQFEASRIAPRMEADAGLADWEVALEETLIEAPPEPLVAAAKTAAAPQPVMAADGYASTTVDGSRKMYTGTPISLDFYETDIKNVFRILQHISGRNFAIDKDVSGRVTLSLEHPVPWDQILDLVLRMNGLGTVEEGNIVRIATLETLRQEENIRNEVIRARKANEKEQMALEPLITEYLLINYSDAQKEITPHVEKLLSDRGSVTVDVRNNQLILTDTPSIIEKARILIEKIDKITPQVVIEARIVEATTQFTKDFGTDWDISTNASQRGTNANIYKEALGGYYGYNTSMNLSDNESSFGLSFARIAGSPLVLNASLSAMETNRDGKIISSPRVVTLDNKKATITQGVEYPYTTRNSDGDVITEFKNIELKLEVTPHVTADNRISMLVTIDKNDIANETANGPSLSTNKVETELLVNDGDTIVIGGILKTTDTDTVNEVPFLGRIPFLGWLFKYKKNNNQKQELLVFMTPRISELENTRF